MEETKIQYVLKHKGLFEAIIVLRINGHEQMFFLYIRKGTNLQKYARKFADYILYGKEKERIMFGEKGHCTVNLVKAKEYVYAETWQLNA